MPRQMDPGVPTASQEALQAPAIDPVFLAALGPTFGLRQMLSSAAMGALSSELPGGGSQLKNTLSMVPGPNLYKVVAQNPMLSDAAQGLYKFGAKHVEDLLDDAGMLKGLEDKDATKFIQEVFWGDKPDIATRVGQHGKDIQIADNARWLMHLLNPSRTEAGAATAMAAPYPGADIGRPLGLAAMLHMLRNAYGSIGGTTGDEVPNQK